jgi:hypothetical protein
MRCQQRLRRGERQRHATTILWTMALALSGAAGCTFVLDSQKSQCETSADCEHFRGHPLCEEGVCVASGLMPDDCTVVMGLPKTQNDFLNACSTSKCVPFKNCDRLMLCDKDKPLPAAQGQITMKQTVPVIPVPAPAADELCTKNAPAGGVIYLYGSADFGPLLRASQPSLSAAVPAVRAVFQGSTSCNGVTAAFDPNASNTLMKEPTGGTGWAFYFDDTGKQVNCRLDDPAMPGRLTHIDIGISNLFSQTCDPAFTPGPPPGVSEYIGPVVPFVLSVPATSGETSISAEAAHMVFGLGGIAPPGSGMINASPWTDWNTYYIRNSGAGSTVLTSLLIDVPRTKFWGVDTLSTENLRDSLLAATANSVTSSIGILSVDFNDTNRGNLKALYLQAKGQNCGYQPDSSPTTIDKVNVRDGHYPLWGYVHFFVADTSTQRAKPMALLFNAQRLEQRLVDDIIKASLTPQCAMKVARNAEMGDFVNRTGFQCGCYFDFKTKGKTSCQSCVTSEDCPSATPACNYGYCEAN